MTVAIVPVFTAGPLPSDQSLGTARDIPYPAGLRLGTAVEGVYVTVAGGGAIEVSWDQTNWFKPAGGTVDGLVYGSQNLWVRIDGGGATGTMAPVENIGEDVGVGTAVRVSLSPALATVTPGTPQSYTASLVDNTGQLVTTASDDILFEAPEAQGTWATVTPVTPIGGQASNEFTSSVEATHTLTAAAAGLQTGIAELTVQDETPVFTAIQLALSTSAIDLGQNVTATVVALDQFGQPFIPASGTVTFSSTLAGTWLNTTVAFDGASSTVADVFTPSVGGLHSLAADPSEAGVNLLTAPLTVTDVGQEVPGAPQNLAVVIT